MANAISLISKQASKLQSKNPGKKWATCKEQARKDYYAGKLGKVGGVKKKGAPKKARKISGVKKKTVTRSRSIGATTGTTGGSLESQLKKQLTNQLGWMLVQVRTAKTVTAKRALNKKAAEITKKLRALS